MGEKYWASYYEMLKRCLKPSGRAGIQVITINASAFETYRKNPDFIQRYVFPGGMLPTPQHLADLGAAQNLPLINTRIFGQDYARTLADWRVRFWDAWPRVAKLGFDDRFKKLWEFYLYYCEAGFRSEYIDVRQVTYQG